MKTLAAIIEFFKTYSCVFPLLLVAIGIVLLISIFFYLRLRRHPYAAFAVLLAVFLCGSGFYIQHKNWQNDARLLQRMTKELKRDSNQARKALADILQPEKEEVRQ